MSRRRQPRTLCDKKPDSHVMSLRMTKTECKTRKYLPYWELWKKLGYSSHERTVYKRHKARITNLTYCQRCSHYIGEY